MQFGQGATERPGYLGGTGVAGSAAIARAQYAEALAFLLPVVLVVALGLTDGGFGIASRHIAGIAVWLIVIGLIVLGAATNAILARPLFVVGGLLTAFAAFTALSALWSPSVERSVIEGDRVLTYLAFFAAAFLIAQTAGRRRRFIEGLAVGVAVIGLLALISRLLPDVISQNQTPLANIGAQARLAYPLGYWNADGAVFGMAIVLSLWMGRHGSLRPLRWIAIGVLPSLLLALYFTYSRGGVLTLVVGLAVLLALSHDRLWHLISFILALLVTAPLILLVQSKDSLANGIDNGAGAHEGLVVFGFLLLATAIYVGARAAKGRLEARSGAGTERVLELSRDRRVLIGVAIAAVAAIAVAAALLGPKAWDRFSSPDVQFPTSAQQHFTDLEGAGRYDFWRVAFEGFEDDPIAGHGAGTYEFQWDRHRSIAIPVKDAHSLYIESLDELGLIGGGLAIGLVIAVLVVGAGAWRRAKGEEKQSAAALLAVAAGFAAAAAIDWDWELAAVGAIFFLAAGALTALACSQRDPRQGRAANGQGRYVLAIAAVIIGWISVVGLLGPLVVHYEISSSQAAVRDGNLADAVGHAQTARDVEPWAASPYLQLALISELQRDYPDAMAHINAALDREDGNWELWLIRARIEKEAGSPAASARDAAHAKSLNPRSAGVIDDTLAQATAPGGQQ